MPKPPRHKQGRYLCAPLSALIDDRLSKSERLVLLGLYSFHNHKTDSPVFPSRSALAKRSDLNNTTRVSELTNGLAQKGWITKKRKGFTNRIDYRLHIPPYVMWQMFGSELSKLAEKAVIIKDTIIMESVTPKVIETITPKVIETITPKEHTILTNQFNKPHMGERALFDRFWNEYPKQVGRNKAQQTWLNMNPSEQDLNVMLINISDRLNQGAWSLDSKQYIPHPSNYLEGEQWSDEIIQRNNNGSDTRGNKLSTVDRVSQGVEERERQRQANQRSCDVPSRLRVARND